MAGEYTDLDAVIKAGMPMYHIIELTDDRDMIGKVTANADEGTDTVAFEDFPQDPVNGDVVKLGNQDVLYTISNVDLDAKTFKVEPDLQKAIRVGTSIRLKTYDATKFDQAVADVKTEMDRHLSVKYPLPFATVPPDVTQLASEGVRYMLYRRRDLLKKEDNAKAYKFWTDQLKALAKGDQRLSEAFQETATKSIVTNKTSSSKVFTDEKLNQFR